MTIPNVLTERDKEEMRSLRARGMTLEGIAKKFGVSRPTVHYHLKRPSTFDVRAGLQRKYREAIDRVYALTDDLPLAQAVTLVARETGIVGTTLFNLVEVYRLVEQPRPKWERWSDAALLAAYAHNSNQIDVLSERLETRETASQYLRAEIKRRHLAVPREEN